MTAVAKRRVTTGDRKTFFSQAATSILSDKLHQSASNAGNPKIMTLFSDKLFAVMGNVGMRMKCMLLAHEVFVD